ncbi:hypothetical protein M2133_001673 [Parabacteroides sp. PF5-6]|nr:hypothetical protein [Parabacteroides sp. PF5-6]
MKNYVRNDRFTTIYRLHLLTSGFDYKKIASFTEKAGSVSQKTGRVFQKTGRVFQKAGGLFREGLSF